MVKERKEIRREVKIDIWRLLKSCMFDRVKLESFIIFIKKTGNLLFFMKFSLWHVEDTNEADIVEVTLKNEYHILNGISSWFDKTMEAIKELPNIVIPCAWNFPYTNFKNSLTVISLNIKVYLFTIASNLEFLSFGSFPLNWCKNIIVINVILFCIVKWVYDTFRGVRCSKLILSVNYMKRVNMFFEINIHMRQYWVNMC